jgi:predicted transcriptional regulator of viral defense system
MNFQSFKSKIKELPIFSSSLIPSLARESGTLKVQLTQWKKKGWILALRKGLYVLSQDNRQVEPTLFFLANQIFVPSYVSLESALSFYGFIPEYVGAVTSVTVRKTCRFKNDFGLFTYQHVKSEAYGGFKTIRETDRLHAQVAEPEKAIVDFLYLNQGKFDRSGGNVFQDSYRFQNCERLKPNKLLAYARLLSSGKLMDILKGFMKELEL